MKNKKCKYTNPVEECGEILQEFNKFINRLFENVRKK